MMRRAPSAALVLVLTSLPPLAAEPPLVATRFALEAREFASNLAPAARAALEAQVAEHLAALGQGHFGFLRWAPAGPAAAAPAAELVAIVRAEPRGFASRITLELAARLAGAPRSLPDLPPFVLYEAWDDQPTNNPVRFLQDLRDRLRARFESDDFRRRLHDQFLRDVPISDRVVVSAAEKRLIVPIPWDTLRARSESVLLVSFVAGPPSVAAKEGSIQLSPEGRIFAGGSEGGVRCLVRRYTFPPVAVEGLGAWDDSIPTTLRRDVLKTLRVFVTEYVPELNHGTDGALATRP